MDDFESRALKTATWVTTLEQLLYDQSSDKFCPSFLQGEYVDYKNHAIVASAFEDTTQKWIPNISISWTSVGCQLVHHLRPLMVKSHPDYFLTSFASCQDAGLMITLAVLVKNESSPLPKSEKAQN